MGTKARIVFMGTPAFATACLRALHEAGHDIAAVVTAPDKPAGRGLKMHISDVKRFALENNLPVFQPEKLRNPGFIQKLKELKADIFVVVAFRMLPAEVWQIPPKGTFNLHASLLPRFRGAAPINHAIIQGEKITGVTTFLIDEQIDTGNIILRKEEPIYDADTAGTLHDRLMKLGAEAVLETVELLMEGKAQFISQKEFIRPGEILPEAPKIHREFCRLSPHDSAEFLERKVRGLSPCPGTWLLLDDGSGEPKEIKVFSASVLNEDKGTPSRVFSDGKSYLGIQTSKKILLINELQSPGKKRLPIRDWLAGIRSEIGEWRVL